MVELIHRHEQLVVAVPRLERGHVVVGHLVRVPVDLADERLHVGRYAGVRGGSATDDRITLARAVENLLKHLVAQFRVRIVHRSMFLSGRHVRLGAAEPGRASMHTRRAVRKGCAV